MVHYTVLLPQRDSTSAVSRLLPQLCQVLGKLILPYEIICIDDASAPPAADDLEALLHEYAHLRVLRFDQPRGTSAALCAGMLAARGDLVIAIDPNTRFAIGYVPHLIARLSQSELVVARREGSLAAELCRPFVKLVRMLTISRELQASEDLFWAARREALSGLALARGAFRALGELVAKRGFRVCQLTFAPGRPPQGTRFRPGFLQRWVAAWFDRRFEPHLGRELVVGEMSNRPLTLTRVDVARPHSLPQAATVPVEKDREGA